MTMCDRVSKAASTLIDRNGYAPTVREIAAEADLNAATVHELLRKLKIEGVLTWDEGRPRTLRFLGGTDV